MFKKIVQKVIRNNECALNKMHNDVCAPENIINHMRNFIKEKKEEKKEKEEDKRLNRAKGKRKKEVEENIVEEAKSEKSEEEAKSEKSEEEAKSEKSEEEAESEKSEEEAEITNNKLKSNKEVLDEMKRHLSCDTEICVISSQKFLQFAKLYDVADILRKYYKPEGPGQTVEWLSNNDIDSVLEQLALKRKTFLHISYQTRDFQQMQTDMAKLDFVEVFNKYNTFGVVFNTDYSTGRGIHWFAVFGEKKGLNVTLEYFNSSGVSPLPEIQEWLIRTKNELSKEFNTEIIYVNSVEMQEDDHSCGVYSLSYIWLRLEGAQPKWFSKEDFNDNLMLKMRGRLFR